MRSSSSLPLPYDKEAPRRHLHSRWLSRRSRYCLLVVVALSLVFLYVTVQRTELIPLPLHGLTPPNDDIQDKPAFDARPPEEVTARPPATMPPPASTPPSATTWPDRADAVRSAFRSAYTAYEQTAYPHDELKPLTAGFRDNLNGWGASLVDSLDTMVLMGLDDIVNRSLAHVAKLELDRDQNIQFFETVIRYLGGMLSAHALTDNPLFLARADELGTRLLPIFNTTHGLPTFNVNMRTGRGSSGWVGPFAILSEFASCQMEYRYLAHLTGRTEYVKVVDRLTDFLQQNSEGGLFPLHFAVSSGHPAASTYSVGAQADSAYEYLLKQWLMTNKTESHFLDMYLRSADAIIEHMLYVSPERQLLYVTDVRRPSLAPVHDFQHLSCFLAGLFALGTATIPDLDPRHAWAAEGLAHTCWITYADMPTGLGPESVRFMMDNGKRWVEEVKIWEERGRPGSVPPGVNQAVPVAPGESTEYSIHDSRYLLRPETIESFYLMWRTTGDVKWRERGWALFESIEKHAKVGSAYASVKHVQQVPAPHEDDMPSFFFAETLKYAFLLFTDEELIPLDKYVFNTEAHPIPIFTWAEWEKDLFGLNKPAEAASSTQ